MIAGVDTFADAIAIPVDLARGDYLSAGLDLIGVFPFAGEAADAAKIAKLANKSSDAAKAAKKVSSVSDNAKRVGKKYNLNKNGYFGEKGKNTRIFKSDNLIKSSADFYNKIKKGGRERALPNGKGVQTNFPDKSSVVYRVITKTPNSPAIEITIKTPGKIKPQKLHFIKE